MKLPNRLRPLAVSASLITLIACGKVVSHENAVTPASPGQTASAAGGTTVPEVFTGHIDPASFGIPLYPGAKQSSEGGGMASTSSEGNGKVLVLTTPDSYELVVAWYKSRLPAEAGSVGVPGLSTITFRAGPESATDGKFATVSSLNGQTSITLSSGHNAPTAAAASGSNNPALADLSPMGLPLYPNVFESGWTGNFSTDKEAARVGQMSSHDSFDAVYAWYHTHMPAGTEPAAAAASNHTTDDGDRMAVFMIGETPAAASSRVMLLRGKTDDYTTINLGTHVTR